MRHFLLPLTIVLATTAYAQFNDSTNYYIKHSSTGIINKTNDQNSYVLNNTLRVSIYKKSFSVNTTNSWIYGKQQHQLANNDYTATVDFDLYKTDRHIYYWGLLNYEKSYSLKIRNRFQGGLGVGYYLIDRKAIVIQLSDGILYERSDLTSTETTNQLDYETYRNSLRFKLRYVYKDFITLENIDLIQHSFSDRKDYIIKSNTNLSVRLYKWFSIAVAVTYNKLNVTHRENLLVNYGLTFERYF
jgi:hypothetical protein